MKVTKRVKKPVRTTTLDELCSAFDTTREEICRWMGFALSSLTSWERGNDDGNAGKARTKLGEFN
jgi:hypothetical protein